MGGTVTPLAYLVQYTVETLSHGPYWLISGGYAVMLLVGWLGTYLLRRADRRDATPSGARVFAIVFACAGLVLTVFAIGVTTIAPAASAAIPPYAIIVVAAQMMGLCFMATGLLAETRWIVLVGGGWLAASLMLLGMMTRPVFLLAAAGVWLGLMLAPGLYVNWKIRRDRRRAPSSADRAPVDAL